MSTGANLRKIVAERRSLDPRVESWAHSQPQVEGWGRSAACPARPVRALRPPPDRESGGPDRSLPRPSSRRGRGPPRSTSRASSASEPNTSSGPSLEAHDDALACRRRPRSSAAAARRGRRRRSSTRAARARSVTCRAERAPGRARGRQVALGGDAAQQTPSPVTGIALVARSRARRPAVRSITWMRERVREVALATLQRTPTDGQAARSASLQRRPRGRAAWSCRAPPPSSAARTLRRRRRTVDAGDIDVADRDERWSRAATSSPRSRDARARGRGRGAKRRRRRPRRVAVMATHWRRASTRFRRSLLNRRRCAASARHERLPSASTSPAPIVSSRSPLAQFVAQEGLRGGVDAHPGDALAAAGVGGRLGHEQAGDARVVLRALARRVDVEDDARSASASACAERARLALRAREQVRLEEATTRRGLERARGLDRRARPRSGGGRSRRRRARRRACVPRRSKRRPAPAKVCQRRGGSAARLPRRAAHRGQRRGRRCGRCGRPGPRARPHAVELEARAAGGQLGAASKARRVAVASASSSGGPDDRVAACARNCRNVSSTSRCEA